MPLPAQFLSCDWGTTSFRLRLVATARDEVIGEIRTDEGVKCVFAQSKSPSPQPELFASIMRTHVRALAEQHYIRCAPLVISGMASSTIGWMPLAYASIPFGLDGSGLVVQRLEWEAPRIVGSTLLVSGAANENDMMRGEECQVIGTFADTLNRPYRNSSVLILPGTHSKHIVVENERVIGLQTFMTGELFEVLSKHSILSASMDSSNDDFFFSGLWPEFTT